VNEEALAFLNGPEGCAILARLSEADLNEAHTLSLLAELRKTLPADLAGAALTLARLRERGAAKFSRAGAMFFTSDALEQASGEAIARYRARRFAAAGYTRIADLGCGIGGDALALAGVPGTRVIGVDRDPLRLKMARANVCAYGHEADWLRRSSTRRGARTGGVFSRCAITSRRST